MGARAGAGGEGFDLNRQDKWGVAVQTQEYPLVHVP